MKSKRRRVVIIIGSDSDLPQCLKGLEYMRFAESTGMVKVKAFFTASIHRNTENVLDILRTMRRKVDAFIIGAGKANHLTGTADAYLRHGLHDYRVPVFGVAFEGKNGQSTLAAILSIIEVPSTQVLYTGVGTEGFMQACRMVARIPDSEWPKIEKTEKKPVIMRSLADAIKEAKQRKEAKDAGKNPSKS